MGQDPEAIRQDIERTRAEMTETVEAIGYKADVPARTKEAMNERVEGVKETVTDKVDSIKEKVGLAKDKATDTVSGVMPSGGGSSEGSSLPSPGAAVGTQLDRLGVPAHRPAGDRTHDPFGPDDPDDADGWRHRARRRWTGRWRHRSSGRRPGTGGDRRGRGPAARGRGWPRGHR